VLHETETWFCVNAPGEVGTIVARCMKTGTVMKRYRGHLILIRGYQEADTDDWRASIHVEFNEDNLTFRDVQLPADFLLFNKDSL
jgi:hypothetical protein